MNILSLGKATALALLLTPIFFVIAFIAAAGGHGTYIPAALFFPYSTFFAAIAGEFTNPFLMMGVLQYPLYGLFLDWGRAKKNLKIFATILAIVHGIFAAVAILLALPM